MNKQTIDGPGTTHESLLERCSEFRNQDIRAESHYLLQCHRIALDFGPRAAERAMELFSNSD